MSWAGCFMRAAAIMPRPSGPAPAMTTVSWNSMLPRCTAWIEQASGSTKAAWCAGMPAGTLWLSAPTGNFRYSAMAPGVRWRKP